MTGPLRGAALVRQVVAKATDPDDPLMVDAAIGLVDAADIDDVLHPSRTGASDAGRVLAVGLAASPGVASGIAVFDAWRALDAVDAGSSVILVRTETSPADEPAMSVVDGVLTSSGGLTSHAAVVARGRGLPAVCGADSLAVGDDSFTTADGTVVNEGDAVSIDGSTGEVLAGLVALDRQAVPDELRVLLGWADERRRQPFGVRANADTPADAIRARAFGAEGIGLCRTEHLFLDAERLPLVQRMILASTPEAEQAALDELYAFQVDDLEAVFAAMDGATVTVRLLDPPLHEFLPSIRELEADQARGELDETGQQLLIAARRWHEHNPMLGVRGVRLAMLKPDLYRMQVRAVVDAMRRRRGAGGDPRPQLMIPLVSATAEFARARAWADEQVAAIDATLELPVGAMVETPRAALLAGELAEQADFLSFGTNDLTQMTFGFSRDDIGRILDAYLEQGLLPVDPFAVIDRSGVGELVRLAVERARRVRPDIGLGVCGEHGGDPTSIAFFLDIGVDYVSCSPYRVPGARLAAAQASLSPARG